MYMTLYKNALYQQYMEITTNLILISNQQIY